MKIETTANFHSRHMVKGDAHTEKRELLETSARERRKDKEKKRGRGKGKETKK